MIPSDAAVDPKRPYSVQKDGAIYGPYKWGDILRGLREGQFLPEDSIRWRRRSWRTIESAWQRESRAETIFYGVYTVIFLAAAIACIYLQREIIYLADASNSWPVAPGKIIQAEVDQNDTQFSPKISYSYEVGRKKYIGSQVAFDTGLGPKSWAQTVVSRHPPGSTCSVSYPAGHPYACVLEPGFSLHTFQMLVGGLIFFYLSLLFAGLTLKFSRKKIPRRGDRNPTLKKALIQLGLGAAPAIIGFSLIQWMV